jgi:uncharacterized membrane protein YagU involved in acid resistance
LSRQHRSAWTGALAGLAATVPMTAAMLAINRLPPKQRLALPPKRIANQLASKVPPLNALEGPAREAFVWSSHGLYGAASGAIFGLLAPRQVRARAFLGALFGLAVWGASYPLWLPAAGVDEAPSEHSWRRVAEQVLPHLIWGAATGALMDRWPKPSDGIRRKP